MLWDEALELATGEESSSGVFLVAGEVPLGFEVQEMLTGDGFKVVTGASKVCGGKLVRWVACHGRQLVHIVGERPSGHGPGA